MRELHHCKNGEYSGLSVLACSVSREQKCKKTRRYAPAVSQTFLVLRSGAWRLRGAPLARRGRVREYRNLPSLLASPALGEGREKHASAEIAAASGCGYLARSRSSPAILTPPSSCGRNFSRSRDRPDPAGARLSEIVLQRTEKGPVARSATPQASAGGPPEAVCGGHFPSVIRRAPAAPWLLAVSSERLCAPPTFP